MQRLLSMVVFTTACISVAMAAEDVILLNPLAPRGSAFEVPLFGYKQFPEEIFAGQKGEEFGLPTELIYASAAKVPAIKAAAAESGKAVFDLGTLEVIALARSKRNELESGGRPSTQTMTIVPWVQSHVDASFVTALLSSELVESDFDVFDSEIIGDDVEMISINRRVGIDFWNAYSKLGDINRFDPSEQINQFNSIQATLSKYPVLLQAAKITLSPVSFGEIFAFSAAERDLDIPPPISKKYDVYWVEFPLSLRNLEDDYVRQVSFHVFLPDDSTALDLIPWRYGVEAAVTETTGSPPITIKDVTIGEFYRKTVAYTMLRPTIVATGLREHRFSWVLTEEAASTGSYLFVVLLGVPKNQCRMNAGLAVDAETTDWLGLQGDVAGTGVIFTEINLPC